MILAAEEAHERATSVQRAVEVLERGGLVVYPTDTAYGLGCDSDNKRVLERLYQVKQRDRKKPLSLICADMSVVSDYGKLSNVAFRLMKRHLPGPFTFVLPAGRRVPKHLMPRKRTIGVRVPDHPVPLALAEGLGRALVTTTVCLEGNPALNEPWAIESEFGNVVDLILDGGPLPPGRQATVVDLLGDPEILRQGIGELET